jgi:KUP system potassium uptake protein
VVIVLVKTLNVPHVDVADRVIADDLGYRDDGIAHVTAHFGFRDRQNVPETLALAATHGVERAIDVERASYFLSRIAVVPTGSVGMRPWRKKLFILMWRNEADPTEYFAVPDERAVTMGSIIEL